MSLPAEAQMACYEKRTECVMVNNPEILIRSACSLVGFWPGLGWLVLVCYERKTLLAGWFGLTETNKRTWWI